MSHMTEETLHPYSEVNVNYGQASIINISTYSRINFKSPSFKMAGLLLRFHLVCFGFGFYGYLSY